MGRKGFSDGSDGKESACNVRDVGEDPLEEEMSTHSSVPAWKSHGQRSLGELQSKGSQGVRHG